MKIRLYQAAVSLLILSLSGCGKFLEPTDKDLLIPTKADDYTQMLRGEAYPSSSKLDDRWIVAMTDDVEVLGSKTKTENIGVRGAYTWQKDIDNNMTSSRDVFYAKRYENILACNIVINHMRNDKIVGTTGELNLLMAQALTLRAYHYFLLVNLYAKPYNASDPNKDLGVPIWTEAKPSLAMPARETLAKCYKFIMDDLQEAINLFKTANAVNNKFDVSRGVAYQLASRTALFMNDWANTIKYGKEALHVNSILYNITQINPFTISSKNEPDYVLSFINAYGNPEIVWNFGGTNSTAPILQKYVIKTTTQPCLVVSRTAPDALYKLYSDNDVRKRFYLFADKIVMNGTTYTNKSYDIYPIKFNSNVTTSGGTLFNPAPSNSREEAMRTAEVYLNLAEAYLYNNQADLALEMLNNLRKTRINGVEATITSTDFTNKEELLALILKERRMELCFDEQFRWWDLRRNGMPRIEHRIEANNSSETYVLEKGDAGYVVNFPTSELDVNKNLVENIRPERTPIDID